MTHAGQGGKAKEEAESTEQYIEIYRSATQHNRHRQREHASSAPEQKMTTNPTRRNLTRKTATRLPSRWSRKTRARRQAMTGSTSSSKSSTSFTDSHCDFNAQRDLEEHRREEFRENIRATHLGIERETQSVSRKAILIHERLSKHIEEASLELSSKKRSSDHKSPQFTSRARDLETNTCNNSFRAPKKHRLTPKKQKHAHALQRTSWRERRTRCHERGTLSQRHRLQKTLEDVHLARKTAETSNSDIGQSNTNSC